MTQKEDQREPSEFSLSHFEKNRYFRGKLMTARDMRSDQEYHKGRLEAITKLTTGTGIVSGLEISEFSEEDDQLEITVQPGLAIDGKGRPLIVRGPTTRSLPVPNGDEVYLYLEYDQELKDPVPVPGKEAMSEEKSEESRILEVFNITARETPPEVDSSPPETDLSTTTKPNRSREKLAAEIADSYHRSERSDVDDGTGTDIFIGAFNLTPEGDWRPSKATKRRPYVYDNDMLFSILIDHISDTDNPHSTRVGEPAEHVENELDQVEGFSTQLQQLRSEMQEINDQLDVHTEYTAHKSLKTLIRFLDEVADTFEGESEISRSSLTIVDTTREAIHSDVHTDPDRYAEFISQILTDVQALADALEGKTTEVSYQQFQSAVTDAEQLSAEKASVIEVARTIDRLAETADMLRKPTGVVTGDDE